MSEPTTPTPLQSTPEMPAPPDLPIDQDLRGKATNHSYMLGADNGSNHAREQHETLMRWAVEDGRVSLVDANKLLSEAGHQTLTPPSVEGLSGAEITSQQFSPAAPHQYELPPLPTADETSIETQKSDTQYRNWLAAGQFDKNMGSSLAQAISAQEKTIGSFKTREDFTRWRDGQNRMLQNIWGEQFQNNIKLVQQFVSEIETKQPGLRSYLQNSGMEHSSTVILMLQQQATRLQQLRTGTVPTKSFNI